MSLAEERSALIVANGILPTHSILEREIQAADYVLAADGGCTKLLKMGFVPDAVLGDFDSMRDAISESILKIAAPDQSFTDLEKSVRYLKEHGYNKITITGVTGGRLDHTFGALAVLVKYNLRLVDNFGYAIPLRGPASVKVTTTSGQTISILPLGKVSGLSTQNLKWEIVNSDFNFAERDGTSNVSISDTVIIELDSGNIVVYVHDP